MKHLAFPLAAALVASVPLLPVLSADSGPPQQATAAAPTTPAPAAPAKFYRPVKGIAAIEIIQPPSKVVGKEIVTTIKIKNTSSGRIDLLQVDEYWYDANRQVVTGTMEKYRRPFNPGDVIEMTLKSPVKGSFQVNQLMFSHANGKIDVKKVKKFE